MDENTLHDLHQELANPDALQQAKIPSLSRRYLQALHTDTFFFMQGQEDIVRTKQGTRPGNSFADVVFGFLWARVLKKLETELSAQGILDAYPTKQQPGLFAENTERMTPFIGPTWCDDLCLCVSHEDGRQLESRTATALGLVLDLCHCHGLTPNLRPGKTEVILAFKGKHSRSLKRKYYSAANAGHITAIGEHKQYHVGVVGEYKHLGGTTPMERPRKKPDGGWQWLSQLSISTERFSFTMTRSRC